MDEVRDALGKAYEVNRGRWLSYLIGEGASQNGAEDALHDVIAQILEGKEACQGGESYEALCQRLLTRRANAFKYRNRQERRRRVSIDPFPDQGDDDDGEVISISRVMAEVDQKYSRDDREAIETRVDIQKAIRQLPEWDQRVVFGVFYLGMSAREVGQELGVAEAVVWSALSRRIYPALRELLAPLGQIRQTHPVSLSTGRIFPRG